MRREWKRILVLAVAMATVAGVFGGGIVARGASSPTESVRVAQEKSDIGDGTSPVKPVRPV